MVRVKIGFKIALSNIGVSTSSKAKMMLPNQTAKEQSEDHFKYSPNPFALVHQKLI